MAGLGTGAPIVRVYHEKSMILPDVSRVLACLYEKEIEVDRRPSSSYKSLLRLQASSHVPVPFDDGLTFLEDSREICRYIAETYEHHGYPFLLGKDSLERASIEQWLHHEEHAFNPPSRSLFCHLAFPLAEEDDDIELQKRKLEEVLEVYEQRLGDSEFLAGNKFTLADLVHLPNSQYITDSDKFVYLYDSRKNVQRWWNTISTRKSWQNVLKDIQVVEQQRKQEEFEKQQQRQREHPPTTRRRFRLDPRKQPSTKSQTILVPPPVGIIATSPTASQAEKPLPTKTSPDETLLSTSTTHKPSAVQSKHTTTFTAQRETPPAPVQSTPRLPGYSHIPVQSTSNHFIPATSPTTAENPSRTGADKPGIRGVSLPSESTEIDLTANSKRSSSNEVSQNLRVFHFYEASSHTDEAEPYTEPTPQKPSEMLDRISGTDGPSNATDHVKTSPISAKEDSGSSGFWTDNTATNADTPDKKSVRYTERTPQKPVETIYSRSTDHSATYTSPGKHGSPETHQNLQTEQWHGTVAGLSNLKGETDHSMPTQQVKPGKDVHHSSSQDSEQVSSHPLAQEPVSMDRRLVQGPEMTPQTLYTDQKRDVSSMLWQKTADVRGIAEEDKSSSDHSDAVLPPYARRHVEEEKIVSADHRKDASLPKRVKDEDTQAIPFQTAYDDAHDIAQEARETASAPRRRTQDAYDTSEVRETYHSSSSRPQPIHLPQNAAPPSKQAASEGTRRATAPYPAAQEFIKQARESPASRSTVPHDTQGSTEAETGESSSSKAHLSDSRLADALPPKKFLDGDEYGAIAPLQTGYADDPYNRKRDRDTAAPKRMMSQGAFEEMEMNDSASSEAQAFDHQQADAPQKQRLAEGPQTTASPLKKRYSGGEDATSRPRGTVAQEVQDNFKETKAGDSLSIRKPPSDTRRAPPLLPRRQVEDDHSTTAATQKRYPGTGGTVKEVEESTSMPRRVAGGDAKEMLEETKFAGSASSRAQPLYYDGTDAPSRKQDAIEDPLGATSPLERRYADSEDTTKHSRDTAFKPSKMVGQDAEDTSEEAVRNSTLFRAQPQDARRVATTPSKQAAEDVLSVSPSSPKRYPRAEETSKQPRAAASKPTPIAAQDARDVFRESKVADSTSSIEQPSDTRVAASFQKQEVPDARNTRASFQERYPDVKGATKKSKVTFEDTKSPDSATSRVRPSDSQRDYAPSWKKEATEAPRATSPIKQRHSDVEDTAKHSMDNVSKPTKMVGQDTQGTYEETKASERASDTWQAATTPTEKVATKDGPGETPPSESNAPSDEDTNMRPRGTASAPRRATVEDDRDTFQGSKPADSVLSREQPLSARQPAVTPSRQETEDSYSKISAFHKTRPFVEDSTRQGVDTVVGPRQNGAKDAKDITEETKVADSASSVRERPTYTLQTAHPLSEQAEVEEDARDKDREGTETTSAPKKMVSRDGEHTYGERKIPHSASREQSLDMQASSPLKQAAAEDPRGATKGETSQPVSAQDVKGTSKKSVGTVEETKGHVTFPTSQPVSAQDAQRTDRSSRTPTADQRKDAPTQPQSNLEDTYKEAKPSYGYQKVLGSPPSQAEAGDDAQAIMGEKVFSEQLRKMPKESRLASSKAQPADSRSPTKEERTPSVYQEDHLVPPDSRQQPQTLPTGVRADSSTPKRQQAPVVPSTSEEKSTPSTSPRAKAHDDHTTEEPFRRDTVDDPKGAPLLSSREPTSQVQRATELTPDGDMSSKPSSIDQWRLASAPIQGLTPNSGDDVPGVSTIDQKPTPMIQQSIPSARGANEMVKGEQRMVTSAPAGAQTPDAQHVRPSLQEPDMAERDGESVKMQVPTLQARPTSVPTRRATSDARDVGDNEFANTSDAQRWKALKAKHDSAMIDEDVRDASLSTDDATGDKTTWHASEAQVLDTLPGSTATPVNVRPTSGDELVKRFERDQGAKPPESAQAQTPSDDPRDSVSTQGLPSDALDKARFVKPSSTEGMRPTAGPDSALEAQLAEHKFAPSDTKSARAAQPLSSVESRKEDTSVSAADQTKKPQTIFHQEARPSTPITKQVPSSNSFHDTRKIQQATLDNLPTDYSSPPHVPSYEQVSHTPQTIPSERDMTPVPGTSDSPASNTKVASAEVQEAIPANYHPDELTVPFVPSEKQGSYAGSSTEPHEGPYHDAPSAAHDKGISKYPSRQAPVVGSRPDSTPADSYVRPTSGDEPGILPDQGAESPTAAQETNSEDRRNEVFPTEKKFAPSAQGSVNSVQKRSPAETWKGEAIVAAAEQTEPINIGQQHTQDMRKARTSQFVPAEDIPSDARSGKPDEVALAEQKFASSGNHAPDDHQKVESLRSQGQVSRAKPPFVPSEGPIHDSHSDIDKKTTKVPSSQAQSSDPKPDPTQSHSYEPPTRLFPSQLPNQHEETQALPPLVGPYDSKPSQDLTSDTLGEAKSLKPSSLDQEAMGSALTPDTHLGSAPGEVAPSEQKLLLKDQDSAHPTQKSSSSEPTKEQSTVTAPNEAKMPPTIFSQQDVALAQPKMKDPSSGSQYAPQKLQEITPEDQRITGSIPRQHQVPLDKNTTPPSSQAQSSDLKRDSLPKSVDVNSSSGQQSTTRILRGQGVQLPGLTRSPPLHESLLYPESNEDVPKSSKPPSPNKEVTSAKVVPAPAPDTLLGTSADEIAPDGQNFPLPAQDLARSAQRPSSVEPTKEKGIVASSDQTNEALTIIGQRRVAPSADKEKTPFDLQASELAKPPNENQEQFHAGSAYEQREGPTPDARAAVDENMPLPSSQAQNSEIRPDSASISGVAHRTSGDQPTTRSLRDPQAQPPAGTQNVPTVFLEKIEPGPPSADQELIKPKTSPAPAPEAPQDQDLTTSQLSPSVVSRKDVDDQTNVSQAGLSEPASSDSTRPSENIQEFSPDAYLTKSEKSLLPVKGADPVQTPYEASLDLSSDEKTTMIKGDQTNTISSVSLSASQAVGQPEYSAVKGPPSEEPVSSFSQKNLQRTPPEETSKQQQQIDQSNTRSSKDDSIEARGTANPNILTRPGDIQQSPVKESMQVAQGSRNQQQADQAVFQSTQENEMQIEETEAQDNGSEGAEKIRPDSAPISGTSNDGKATVFLRDSQSQPPVGTLNVPAVLLESPRRPTTVQELVTPVTTPALAPDTPQAEDSTQSPQLSPSVLSSKIVADADQTDVSQAGLRVPGSSDAALPSEEKQEFSPEASLMKSAKALLPMTGTDPVQPPDAVGQSENSAVKRPPSEESVSLFSQKILEKTLPEEKSKQQQQTDQSGTRSSSDDSIEASGTANPNIKTTGDLQPSPVKERIHATEGSRDQVQADQAVFQSTQGNRNQIQENEAQDNGSDGPEEIRSDSAPISGDAHRTGVDGPAISSLRDSQEQPPAGTLNVPTVFLEKIESPRPPSTDQELMTSKTSPAPAPGAPQDQDSTRSPQLSPSVVSRKDVANADRTNVSQAGLREPATSNVTRPEAYLTKSEKPLLPTEGSNPVQTPNEASFDLSSNKKPTMIKGEQANTTSNVSLSASQPVGQSETSAVKGPLSEDLVSSFSEKNLERTLSEEKPKLQQKTDRSSGTASPNILTTSGGIQPSSPLKESMQAAQGSRNQQQAGQAVFESMQDNVKKIEETEAQDNGSDKPKEIRPDSAPISGDVRRTRDSLAEPPAGTLNVPAVFLENIESPRPMTPMNSPAPAPDTPQGTAPREAATAKDSTQSPQLSPSVVSRKDVANADQTNVPQAGLREPASSGATRPSEEIQELSADASLTKSAKPLLPMTGTNPVQPPHEASFDLSSDGKPGMIKGDQANTISNVSLSASQAVGQSENSAVTEPLSEDLVSPLSQKNLEGTSPAEKPNQQQQTDQSNTRSSKDESIVASGTTNPYISTSGDIQPSALKESAQAAEGSRDQQPADQDVFQSTLDTENQFVETEARDVGPDELAETNLQQSTNQKNNGPSQRDALEQSAELIPAVQSRSNDTNIDSKQTMEPPASIQEDNKSETSLRSSEESKQQVWMVGKKEAPASSQEDNKSETSLRSSEESKQQVRTVGKTQGGESKAPASKTEQPEERDLRPLSNKGIASQSQQERDLAASQPVGQSENSAVKGPLSEDLVSSFSKKNLERTLPEEKPKQQQQTDQSSTTSAKDNSIEASRTASPNILTTSGGIQPSALKEGMQAAQQQAGQAVFESMQDNVKKIEEMEAQDNGSNNPKEIRPDSAPIGGDARRTSDDGPASDSWAEPPAGTLTVPAVFLENIKSPRPMTPMTSLARAPDAPQDQDSTKSPQLSPSVVSKKDVANADQTNVPQEGLREPASLDATRPSEKIQELSADASLTKSAKPLLPMTGTNPVQPPHEASFDLSSDGKPGMIKGDQANTISNVSLSASQAVGQSENSAVTEPLSEYLVSPLSQKSLEGTSPEEKPNQQQQTDQSNTRSSKDESIEASGTTNPYISTSRDIQPSALKERIQAAEGSRNQQQADQAVFESAPDNENQFVETEARHVGPDKLAETNLQQSTNQKNNGGSQRGAFKQPEDVPAKDAPGSIQENEKSESSLRTSEESKQQPQTNVKTQAGETKAPAAEIKQPEGRDVASSNKVITNQSGAETSYRLEEQTSPGIKSSDTDSSNLEGSTDDMKSADTDNNPQSP